MTARNRRKALPALAASLSWFKRGTINSVRRSYADAERPAMRSLLASKIAQLRAMPPAKFRDAYISLRTGEITRAPLWELTHALKTRGVVFHRL